MPGRMPGPPGPPGPPTPGRPGPPGPPGDKGPNSSGAFHVVYHAQSDREPGCPTDDLTLLWTGYSLMYTVGNGQARGQDLGSAGSCQKKFSPVPFLSCSLRTGGCKYGQKQDVSVWLAGTPSNADKPVPNTEIVPSVSRCSVCATKSQLLAVHSQDNSLPDCPNGYRDMWDGYSFLMSIGRGKTGVGQQLSSAGSCLKFFRPSPGIECQGGVGMCTKNSDRYSFWLRKVDKGFAWDGKWEQRMGLAQAQSMISRCRVCMRLPKK